MLPQTTDCEITTAVQHRKKNKTKSIKLLYNMLFVWFGAKSKKNLALS